MKQIRLLIVDDHPLVCKGISMFLETEPSVQIVGEAKNGWDAIRQARRLTPDVVLMDLIMPQGNGVEAIAELKRCSPTIKIIVVTGFSDEKMAKAAIKAGADGYLLKDADGETLLNAIQSIQQGHMQLDPSVTKYLGKDIVPSTNTEELVYLTEQEEEVLRLVIKGLKNRAIARALNIGVGTVKMHLHHILGKLNATNRIVAALRAVELGLISMN